MVCPAVKSSWQGIIIWQHLVLEVLGADGVDDKDGGVKVAFAAVVSWFVPKICSSTWYWIR